LKVFSTETVYTASFGGTVKASVPENWLVLAFSCCSSHLISHSTWWLLV